MMPGRRKRYSAELKTKVAVEAIKAQKTANEIAAEYGVHPTQIAQWKKQALDGLPEVFSPQAGKREKSEEALIASHDPPNRPVESAGRLVGKKIKSSPLRRNER